MFPPRGEANTLVAKRVDAINGVDDALLAKHNNGVTHKIDPNIDLEREYVEKTLTGTRIVTEFTYILPKDALREAKTATGGTFQSDGRVLVLRLRETAEFQ